MSSRVSAVALDWICTDGPERYSVLNLQPADPMSSDRPPPIYEPVLLGFAPIAFRLRGFERVETPAGGYSVLQEWHIEEP